MEVPEWKNNDEKFEVTDNTIIEMMSERLKRVKKRFTTD